MISMGLARSPRSETDPVTDSKSDTDIDKVDSYVDGDIE